jgi:aminomethyltransferase
MTAVWHQERNLILPIRVCTLLLREDGRTGTKIFSPDRSSESGRADAGEPFLPMAASIERVNVGLRTALFDWHQRAGARIVDFGGWDMPILYSTITEEHQATRRAIGLFDVSHMGRLWFDGPDAVGYLDRLLTNQVANLEEGQVRYSLVLNESGGIKDDILVYRVPGRHMMVVNASNRLKLLDWFESQKKGDDVRLIDVTLETSMIAVQGPAAIRMVQEEVAGPVDAIGYYRIQSMNVRQGGEVLVSRTGYTGEDGVELIGEHQTIVGLWERLLDAGREEGARPAGLGARDTLRLEAGMPLYGHELSEQIDPIAAGLGWAVASNAKDFIGKSAVASLPTERAIRVGIKLEGKRIPREGFSVTASGEVVGTVSSGTFSPTLEQAIAMAYVDPSCRPLGTQLGVDIRGTIVPATVVKLPFYKRPAAGGM